MKTLETVEFIRNNPDWEKILTGEPYFITVSRDYFLGRNLVLLKYNQIESDFNLPIVRECRGLILDADTLNPVCVPFFKFGNYGEKYCPEIDWKSCWVGSKLDGSLIKMVRIGNSILVSTNGTIDAYKANLAGQIGCKAKSFGELVDIAIDNAYLENHPETKTVNPITTYNWMYYLLEEGKTYMFELTSPFNRVVVPWKETRLNFLGVRNNSTLEETYFTEHELGKYFRTPKVFPLTNIDECIAAASELDLNEEGYVVCDRNFNRVKVKSPLYVKLHHMANNHCMTYDRAMDIVKSNEIDEVVTYFPEFGDVLFAIKDSLDSLVRETEDEWKKFMIGIENRLFPTRKDSALWITKNFRVPGVGFAMLDKKIGSVKDGIMRMPNQSLLKILGY